MARLHARVANIRKDAVHQATARIVARTKPDAERPAVIVLEDLNVPGMVKNKIWRALSDVGMGEFRRQTTYKSVWAGERLLIAPRFYASTSAVRRAIISKRRCSYLNGRTSAKRAVRSKIAISTPHAILPSWLPRVPREDTPVERV